MTEILSPAAGAVMRDPRFAFLPASDHACGTEALRERFMSLGNALAVGGRE